ncbi:MAG: NAD(+) synthase [Erysipelotrichia bacterium]|nr:NAD(+) synthase [Erysipelotrichia bacterium]NCC54899.1 NAD(+) synthase [Erysipelotrichia bacterium]
MKIAMAQMNVVSAHVEENFQKMKQWIAQAKQEKADIIVFPEMCVSGYLLQDKWLDDEFCRYVHSYNDKIKALSDGIGIVFGNLYYAHIEDVQKGRDGRQARFNAILFAHNQEWVKKENGLLDGVHIKHLNPDYRIFDDSRYFLSGIEVSQTLYDRKDALISPFLFHTSDQVYRIGLEACEDMWSNDYSLDVSALYTSKKVDFILNASSSPYTLNKEKSRDKRIKEHAYNLAEQMVPFIYVNVCGMQNTGKNIVVFDGGSTVYDAQGERVFSMNDAFKEELSYYDFKVKNTYTSLPNKCLSAICCAIQEVDRQMFHASTKWIIGLSGGIDSSINACLLVMALGKKRVIGYNMASAYNSLTTKNNARILADALGIEIREGSIEQLNKASIATMQAYGYQEQYGSLVYENIQARIRGHLLSTFASIEGGVIVNNANKIEVALGYCTLYGDCIGAFSPLGDLTKVQCFEIAKQCNDYFGKEVISKTLIPEIEGDCIHWDMPPSAELKDAQLDPMKWFYHDQIIQSLLDYPSGHIEDFMQSYFDDSIYESDMGKWIHYYHLEQPEAFINDLEWLLKTMQNAVFKRIQMPPIVMLSRGAYGSDYREAQLGFIKSERYEVLKAKILAKKSS